MDLSIIIVSYNTADLIAACLESVLSDNMCIKEIFVIDNASTDGSVEVIRKKFPDVSITVNNVNKGYAAANNQAINECRGRYIFFLNPDTIVTPGSLGRMVAYMDTHPDVGLAGTRVINQDGSPQESVSYHYPGEKYASQSFQGLKGKIACVLGASMIVRTGLIQSIGGFDEDYFLYGEDQDLALRVRRNGFEIGFIDDAAIIHLGGQSERYTPSESFWEKKVRAEHLFYLKHYDNETIKRILRADFIKSVWRIHTLRLSMILFGDDRKNRDKLVKYETIRGFTRETAHDQREVSIVICFYNNPDYLKHCLDSLRAQAEDFKEVIIADDGSDDDVVSKLRSMIPQYNFPIIHAWHPREGARRAACRNNGIRHAKGNYLIFLDADFAVLPDFIRSHLKLAEPGVFIAGRCKYLDEDVTKDIIKETIPDTFLNEIYQRIPDTKLIKDHREFIKLGIFRSLHIPGAFPTFGGHFSAYMADVKYINGYDENFIGWGGEDIDFAIRMSKAGFKGRSAICNTRALHLWHPKELGSRHWKEGPNMEYFQRKKVPYFCKNGLVKTGPSGL